MGFWHEEDSVEQYVQMCEGYDPKPLIDKLEQWLEAGCDLLELGMGPGVDLDLLRERYKAVGSDFSPVFVQRYQRSNPGADVLELDAVSVQTDRRFDAIYSNKVLQHLPDEDFTASLTRQSEILRPGGVLIHTIWRGDSEQTHHGMLFVYRDKAHVEAALPKGMSLVHAEVYEEMAADDSLLFVARKA